jgi:hypothetical protein
MTASIDLSNKKQQSSFASEQRVVATPEYPSKSIIRTTMLSGVLGTSFRLYSIVLLTSRPMTCFEEGTKNIKF